MSTKQKLIKEIAAGEVYKPDDDMGLVCLEDVQDIINKHLSGMAVVPVADIKVIKELWDAEFEPDEQLQDLFKLMEGDTD